MSSDVTEADQQMSASSAQPALRESQVPVLEGDSQSSKSSSIPQDNRTEAGNVCSSESMDLDVSFDASEATSQRSEEAATVTKPALQSNSSTVDSVEKPDLRLTAKREGKNMEGPDVRANSAMVVQDEVCMCMFMCVGRCLCNLPCSHSPL